MQFAQTAALMAITEDDHVEAERIVRGLYPQERAALSRACEELAGLCVRLRDEPMVTTAPYAEKPEVPGV